MNEVIDAAHKITELATSEDHALIFSFWKAVMKFPKRFCMGFFKKNLFEKAIAILATFEEYHGIVQGMSIHLSDESIFQKPPKPMTALEEMESLLRNQEIFSEHLKRLEDRRKMDELVLNMF